MTDEFESITRDVAAQAAPQRVRIAPDIGDAATVPHRPVRSALTPVFEARKANVFYGEKHALHDVSTDLNRNIATALIGPSGCGKSTFLRSLNRMNDSVKGFRITGDVLYHGN